MKDSHGMKIKSYFAKTMEEAISKARVELGSDALLLNTRKITDSAGAGSYEVIMGVAGEAPAAASPAPTSGPSRKSAPPQLKPERPSSTPSDMDKLRARMDELHDLLVRSAKTQWTIHRSVPEAAEIHACLIEAEVDAELSKDVADRLEAAMATDAFFMYAGPEPEGAQNRWKSVKVDAARMEQFLRTELEARVPIVPRLGINGSKGAVAVVVGPAGSGKTTSLAKLAIVASGQRPVRLISLEGSGYSAQQLLGATAISNITFSTVASVADLAKLVTEARKKECVLIDTPGFSPHDQPAAEALAAALASCGDVDVHLVAPAYMRARDLRTSIERYRIFQSAKILVTKLDEAETLGTVFSEAARAGLALSFLSHGPRIPQDIRAATVEDLLTMVPARTRARAQHAA